MKQSSCIGGEYPVHDAWQKVTGQQVYTGDMQRPHMLYAKILFSDVAHADIATIDTSQAEQLEGVAGVFTHHNTPDTLFNNYISYVGQSAPEDERLFADRVRFVGDRVAVVVAKTPEIARQALRLIDVTYTPLPCLPTMEQAMADKAVSIHPEGNLLSQAELAVGDCDSAIKERANILETTSYIPRIHHGAMEPHVCLAEYHPSEGLCIWTPCQGAFGVRNMVARYLKMPYCDVRVIKTVTGGSFGGKQQSMLEPIAAFLAKAVKGSVMLQYDREASMLSTAVGTAFQFHVRSALSAEGRLDALDIEALADAGAYATNSVALPFSAGKKAMRLYRIPNLRYRSKSIYTNAPAGGGLRGWGGPQVITAMEIHMDQVAKRNNMCPVRLRMEHLVTPGEVEHYSKISLGNARIRECLTEGVELFKWYRRWERPADTGRFRRGVGLACGGHMNGYFNGVHDVSNMHLKVNEDGTLILNTAIHDQGCGTLISLALIVAEVLEVPVPSVRVLEADTHTSPYDMGTYSSRVTYVCGRCAYEAAHRVRDLLLEQAAVLLQKPKAYVYIQEGAVFVKGSSDIRMSYGEIAALAQTKLGQETAVLHGYSNSSNPGSYGCHFAEAEVDVYTGLVRITDYLAVHDVGRVLNRTMVEGQIQGAVQMGIGYTLTEEVALDHNAVPNARNFDKYTVINLPDMPQVRTKLLEYGGDDGPFGAKSIGEAALVPVMGAVVNAVNHALGTELSVLPLTPKKIVQALWKGKLP